MGARKVIVLGGTGQVGRAVAKTLVIAGWRVTVAHRGSRPLPAELLERGVNCIMLDREMPGALARAVGSGVDVFIDVIAYGANHARQLLDMQHDVAAFVVISSSSVYQDKSGRTLDEAAATAGFPDLPDPIGIGKSRVHRLRRSSAATPGSGLSPGWWRSARTVVGRSVENRRIDIPIKSR